MTMNYDLSNDHQRHHFFLDLIAEQPQNDRRQRLIEDLKEFIDDMALEAEMAEDKHDDTLGELSEAEEQNFRLQDTNAELVEKIEKLEQELAELKA